MHAGGQHGALSSQGHPRELSIHTTQQQPHAGVFSSAQPFTTCCWNHSTPASSSQSTAQACCSSIAAGTAMTSQPGQRICSRLASCLHFAFGLALWISSSQASNAEMTGSAIAAAASYCCHKLHACQGRPQDIAWGRSMPVSIQAARNACPFVGIRRQAATQVLSVLLPHGHRPSSLRVEVMERVGCCHGCHASCAYRPMHMPAALRNLHIPQTIHTLHSSCRSQRPILDMLLPERPE